MTWVFDQMDLPGEGHVLEIGAGPGTLWDANRSRLYGSRSIALTDASMGMVRTARRVLDPLTDDNAHFTFGVVDAQSLPFPNANFDVVIANHMLYHVPQRHRAVREIARVLRTGGTLYATTVGETHMHEMWRLLRPAVPDIMARVRSVSRGFTLENGAALLHEAFTEVERRDFEDALAITEAAPVLAYLDSTVTMMNVALAEVQWQRLADAIAARIQKEGVFYVKKASGLFLAQKT
jgi:ubiquinone/menaquinone biosynthesis C-methylase UbiE